MYNIVIPVVPLIKPTFVFPNLFKYFVYFTATIFYALSIHAHKRAARAGSRECKQCSTLRIRN